MNYWFAFKALPKGLQTAAWIVLAVLAGALAFTLWLRSHDKDVIADHEATIAEQQREIEKLGEEAAIAAATQTLEEADDKLRRSLEAAAVSDDPLAAGIGELD